MIDLTMHDEEAEQRKSQTDFLDFECIGGANTFIRKNKKRPVRTAINRANVHES